MHKIRRLDRELWYVARRLTSHESPRAALMSVGFPGEAAEHAIAHARVTASRTIVLGFEDDGAPGGEEWFAVTQDADRTYWLWQAWITIATESRAAAENDARDLGEALRAAGRWEGPSTIKIFPITPLSVTRH